MSRKNALKHKKVKEERKNGNEKKMKSLEI